MTLGIWSIAVGRSLCASEDDGDAKPCVILYFYISTHNVSYNDDDA